MHDVGANKGAIDIVERGELAIPLPTGLVRLETGSTGAVATTTAYGAQGSTATPDLAFTQQLSPEMAPAGWRPQFHDYLYLGLTSSTAFSPTDVMPLAGWAKLAMAVQSLISLSVLGLVIARAVNVLA